MDPNSDLLPHNEQTIDHSILNPTLGVPLGGSLAEVAVVAASEDREEKASQLYNRARSIVAEWGETASLPTLKTAIFLVREALVRLPNPTFRSDSLDDLETALVTRVGDPNQDDNFDQSHSLNGEALRRWKDNFMRITGTKGLVEPETNPGGPLQLNETASLHQEEREPSLAPHYDGPASRDDFFTTLQEITLTQSANSVEDEISMHRRTLELIPLPYHDRVSALTNLAFALRRRFLQSHRREDLDEAVSLYRNVCEMFPVHHPQRFAALSNLGFALAALSQLPGRNDDLEEAISLHREALDLVQPRDPHRSDCINDLAIVLSARFELSGRLEDLDEGISLHKEALELRAEPHQDRSVSLSNLANALTARFKRLSRRKDMDDAISLHRDAIQLRPAPHHDRPASLNDLATTLVAKYKQSGRVEDVDEAISLRREALELQPAPHPERFTSLHHLARTFNIRFEHSGEKKTSLAAISSHKKALELLPAFLDEAIDGYYQSLNALVSGHPAICTVSANLGRAFRHAYSQTRKSEYLHKSSDAFRIAVTREAPPAYERFGITKGWASHAESKHQSALDVYHTAIQLLPRLAMLGLNLPSRRQTLTSGSDCLARDAAACAIRSGQYEKAVEILEDGRCRFWEQALYVRTPMTSLHDVAPKLAQKLRRISLALTQGTLPDASRYPSDDALEITLGEQEIFPFRRLNAEWLMMLEEVRQLDGFQDFLRPTQVSTLLGAAAEGPVVILNASYAGCAALILTLADVQHVPLPMITVGELTRLVKLIQIAIQQNTRDCFFSESTHQQVNDLQEMPPLSNTVQLPRGSLEDQQALMHEQHELIFQYVLAKLWESVVGPIIRFLNLKKSDAPPNLWWCLTGPFNFLPIHAAGSYRTVDPECVSDYVVSSYTPTIKTLLRDNPLQSSGSKMIVVTQPDTPDQAPLPDTLAELGRIKVHVPIELVSVVGGSVKDVISHLPTTSIVHFACHGQQHAENPLESALILGDGPLKISEIMQQYISNGVLAFLDVCHSATGDQNYPDEALHLGSALLFAGFRGVVATMWDIRDEDGPKIADAFYEYFFKVNNSDIEDTFQPDTTRAAQALHHAVAKLRSEKVSFIRWVPFIHIGR